MDLNELCEHITVGLPVSEGEAQELEWKFEGWYPVSTDEDGGNIAYFKHESDAFAFRLWLINMELNARQNHRMSRLTSAAHEALNHMHDWKDAPKEKYETQKTLAHDFIEKVLERVQKPHESHRDNPKIG